MKAKQALVKWADIVRTNAEDQLIRAYFRSMRVVSPATDTFSSWLLAAIGAAAAFFITNLGSLAPHFYASGIRWALLLLAASVAAGFIQKFFALLANVQEQASVTAETLMAQAFSEYQATKLQIEDLAKQIDHQVQTELRLQRIFKEFRTGLPWLVRWRAEKIHQKILSVPYFGESKAIRTAFRQGICLGFQMIFALAALLCLAVSLQ